MARTAHLSDLALQLLPDDMVAAALQVWLEEDGYLRGDVTSAALAPASGRVCADFCLRHEGVACGLAVVARGVAATGMFDEVEISAAIDDGTLVIAGTVLGTIEGPAGQVLGLERPLLNLLGRLSGVATLARTHVDAVDGTAANICTTRKTTPGLRRFEKYAAACGGATLHRLSLDEAALFKDNHLAGIEDGAFTQTLSRACRAAREHKGLRFVEVEVDTLEQFNGVLAVEPGLVDMVLLDNFSLDMLREAVRRRDVDASGLLLEASGGVSLDTVRDIAETGVDRISVGGITHQARTLDVGLDSR